MQTMATAVRETVPAEREQFQTNIREEFARRLRAAINERGWTQSELARRAAIGRDNVSGYVRGRNLPGPAILTKLAGALELTSDSLLPAPPMTRTEDGRPALQLRQLDDGSNRVWLQLNQAVDWERAMAIVGMLHEDARSGIARAS